MSTNPAMPDDDLPPLDHNPPKPTPVSDGAKPKPKAKWPNSLAEQAFYGLFGDIVRAIEPESESDPAAVLLQAIVLFGCMVGRGPYVPVEGDEHHLNEFLLLAGDTAKARKGTSWGQAKRLFRGVTDYCPFIATGLSSGEGLIYHVRDERKEHILDRKSKQMKEVIVPGIIDKRLMVVEPEFAKVLRQAPRSGNTLSVTVREAWDTGDLMTLTKNEPMRATGAHISLIGHITIDELRAELTQTDSANGFANRLLFMCVKRSKMLPFGGKPLAEDVTRNLHEHIARAVTVARARRAVGMTEAARKIWSEVYTTLSDGRPGLYGAVTARAEAHALRLALAYAMADEAKEIDTPHLLAALAIIERVNESAAYIFGTALGDRMADEIFRALKSARPGGLTRTDISVLFKRNQSAERIGAALDLLKERGMATCHQQQRGEGRPAELWKATNLA